ncbi:MAG: sugar phosphate isomerase/epimerase family protein [Bryobacteraceae bacterium]
MNRRCFIGNAAALWGSLWLGRHAVGGGLALPPQFKAGAISDGFSQDFGQALHVMKSYGLRWVEIRRVFGVYNTDASPAQIRQIKELVDRYGFRVSVIDSALYKCTLPGTTPSTSEKDSYPYAEQMDLLKRACDRANELGADKIRIFTFWRVAHASAVLKRIAAEVQKAVDVAKSHGMRLVIENEESCNVATGAELRHMLAEVPASNLGANWDVGNGYMQGEVSYPDGYDKLDKTRIWHMHLKSMTCQTGLKECTETIAGQGLVDLVGQFKALLRDGYHETMSVECEFSLPGVSQQETAKRSLDGVIRAMQKAVGEKS